MIRVVLDTNVVISALLSPNNLEDRVLKLALAGHVQLYISSPIGTEYERVMASPKFGFKPIRIRSVLRRIAAAAHSVRPMHTLTVCLHDEDNRFLECADAAGADFLITGNKRHYPHSWKQMVVVNSREFLEQVFPTKLPR